MTRREFRARITEWLRELPLEQLLERAAAWRREQVIGALLSVLSGPDLDLRRKAAEACGALIAEMAPHRPEAARDLIRRQFWNLSEESGNSPWGALELLGEVLSRNAALATEYGSLLTSFLDPEGNHPGNPVLYEEAVRAVCRVAQAFPAAMPNAAFFLNRLPSDLSPDLKDAAHRALATLSGNTG